MYYYALVDANNICTAVYAMPAQLSGDSYIAITEEQYNDSTLIGKKYVNGEWVEVTTYYYAILDERGLVETVYESQTEMPAADNMVPITVTQFNDATLIGKYYDRETGTFIEPPISVIAECSTDEVQYKDQEKTLSEKLDEMDNAIANAGGGSAVDAYTKTESDAKYAPAGSSYTKAESDAKYALAGSTGGATMTADEVLEAVKSVDGTGSGLDADKLDGLEASAFAPATHEHSEYAPTEHTHTGYATADHSHSGYASADHTHTGYATTNHTHSASDVGAAATNHTHNNYAESSHTHAQSEISGLASALAGKADSSHSHTGYAPSSHTHSGYASSSHSHSEYFEKSGGTITGETNYSGGLVRVKGVQTLYHSGSQMVLSSENLPTKICGSAITSSKSITVASDERLKADIHELDKQALIDFAKQVQLVSYRYITEEEGTQHIGVIAQQLLEINPEIAKFFVNKAEDGFYSVDYTALSLIPLLLV